MTPESTGPDLYRRARAIIPGGTQLLSKRPEMFLLDRWPSYYRSAKGVQVTDLDGRTYIDMSYNGIGSCVLGYADPDVDGAVTQAVKNGSMSTFNCPEEVELAELLLELHPWARMVRFARTGGESMALAVRIARAHTGRDKVAFCGYHGWHDWYLAANLADPDNLDQHLLQGLAPAGVPNCLAGTALPFSYNDLDGLKRLFETHGDSIGVVVMEPIRSHAPEPGFLEGVRRLCDTHGAVLIMDEITAGFRINDGGAHLTLGVTPDIAVFAKAMSNGYPMAAIIGIEAVMTAAQDSFISSTYWTERIGPTAALATVRKFVEQDVADHLGRIGQETKKAWLEVTDAVGLEAHASGLDPLAHLDLRHPESTRMETLLTDRMLGAGFLATASFYATYAHQSEHVDAYRSALLPVMQEVADTASAGRLEEAMPTPRHTGFERLT